MFYRIETVLIPAVCIFIRRILRDIINSRYRYHVVGWIQMRIYFARKHTGRRTSHSRTIIVVNALNLHLYLITVGGQSHAEVDTSSRTCRWKCFKTFYFYENNNNNNDIIDSVRTYYYYVIIYDRSTSDRLWPMKKLTFWRRFKRMIEQQ